MALKLITPPAGQPVETSDVAAQIRADLTAETSLVQGYIAAVTDKAEALTHRALVTQTWELVLDCFPASIRVPLPPLQSVSSIKYTDCNGVVQTLAADQYTVDTDSEPGRIVPAYGCAWPATQPGINTVRVRFTCGYGQADDVPDAIKNWILLNVANLYEHRETIVVGQKAQTAEINSMADSLLASYISVTF